MKINLSPQRRDDALVVSRTGDILTLNGENFDFSELGEGEVLPRDAVATSWLVSDITRVGGQIELSLILPLGANASEAARFPEALVLTEDGNVELPK